MHLAKTLLATAVAAAALAGCATTPTSPAARAPAPHVAPDPDPGPATVVDRDALRASLAARRALNLQRLAAYADAGVFPRNRHSDGPLNVFIDEDGHICAAANLIDKDGHGDLVRATAARDNFIVLATVHSGALYDWMLTSGFTQEEIAMIQEPYMPVRYDEPAEPGDEPTVISQDWQAQEIARLQAVLRGVHQVLSANSDKSLDLVTQRLADREALALRFLAADQA